MGEDVLCHSNFNEPWPTSAPFPCNEPHLVVTALLSMKMSPNSGSAHTPLHSVKLSSSCSDTIQGGWMKTMKKHSWSASGVSCCERVHFIARKRKRWSISGSDTGSKDQAAEPGCRICIILCTVWRGSSLTHRATLNAAWWTGDIHGVALSLTHLCFSPYLWIFLGRKIWCCGLSRLLRIAYLHRECWGHSQVNGWQLWSCE